MQNGENKYHALIDDKIFMGGAADVEAMVINEGVEIIVDLREEATECAYPSDHVRWVKIPLDDNTQETEANLFKQAIDEVVSAYNEGKKVAFHCGGGKGRTGTVAAGTILELGLADTFEEAEAKAKGIRQVINIKPMQKELLKQIYARS
ncbi:dual specificity protein phosphatase family protein [Paenibacillus sp. MMS20-IR301]|uniref:protein-tyrosine phosphatase family protein n=1 Tax=Paenibacillus sp. MMS20-IR301 TaxID=2895946 RepID=UPI0028E472B3|nr:dual specificity protein phosphatase family protein [Paenibacillus sp. MMS20-IR301]WNS46108.1 dual specificity protein phosphatase family protein [Paenibacillus sp. MMS20-IR301]